MASLSWMTGDMSLLGPQDQQLTKHGRPFSEVSLKFTYLEKDEMVTRPKHSLLASISVFSLLKRAHELAYLSQFIIFLITDCIVFEIPYFAAAFSHRLQYLT